MTFVLDNRTAIPLHPLDLTTTSSNSGSSCLGLIQSYPDGSSVSSIADVILGVPFMRSTYTVMAYDPPDVHGVFPNASSGSGLSWSTIRPRLGLLGLTNPSVALSEFHTVRVLNEPLPSGTSDGSGGSGTGSANQANGGNHVVTGSGKKLSVGLEVLIGLLGFFALCFVLFAARWAMHKRRLATLRRDRQLAHTHSDSEDSTKDGEYMMHQAAVMNLVRRSTLSSRYGPEHVRKSDTLSRGEVRSDYTDDTARTRVNAADEREEKNKDAEDEEQDEAEVQASRDRELGFNEGRIRPRSSFEYEQAPPGSGNDAQRSRSHTPTNAWNDPVATLVGSRPRHFSHPSDQPGDAESIKNGLFEDHGGFQKDYLLDSPEQTHLRMPSVEAASVAVPLLARTRGDSWDSQNHSPSQRTPLGIGRPQSHARVGSFGSYSSRQRSLTSIDILPPETSALFDEHSRRAGGPVSRDSMAGVGTFNARLSSFSSQYHSSASSPLVHPHSSPVTSPLILLSPQANDHLLHNASRVSLPAEATDGHNSAL